jgi:hypothetical protein
VHRSGLPDSVANQASKADLMWKVKYSLSGYDLKYLGDTQQVTEALLSCVRVLFLQGFILSSSFAFILVCFCLFLIIGCTRVTCQYAVPAEGGGHDSEDTRDELYLPCFPAGVPACVGAHMYQVRAPIGCNVSTENMIFLYVYIYIQYILILQNTWHNRNIVET